MNGELSVEVRWSKYAQRRALIRQAEALGELIKDGDDAVTDLLACFAPNAAVTWARDLVQTAKDKLARVEAQINELEHVGADHE